MSGLRLFPSHERSNPVRDVEEIDEWVADIQIQPEPLKCRVFIY